MDYKINSGRTMEQVMLCCRALDDKKAEDLTILNVEGKSPITDYLIIATGTSEPHLKALRNEIEKTLKAHSVAITGEDRETSSGWVVIDAFDFMVHLFTKEQRDNYSLDSLWKDAARVPLPEALLSA